jgi:predicted ribosomally synthesized peptide with SipW-like signal peptide
MQTIKFIIVIILLSILAVAFTAGTWALFSDNEASMDDQTVSGTLDLKTDDADGVSQTLYATDLMLGETIGPGTIQLKNAGSVAGSTLDIAFSYVETDISPNSVNENADDTAGTLEVITLSYNGSSLLGSVSDSNTNGYIDVYDLANADLTGQSGINPSATKDFRIAIQLRSDTSQDFHADGVTVTMTFILDQ